MTEQLNQQNKFIVIQDAWTNIINNQIKKCENEKCNNNKVIRI